MNSSVVVFRVKYEPGNSNLDLEEALLGVFAFVQGGVVLRQQSSNDTDSPELEARRNRKALRYQSGNYDGYSLQGRTVWVGEMFVYRTGEVSGTEFDNSRGVRIERGRKVDISTDHTKYAFDVDRQAIAFQERSAVPYTRMISYVAKASLMLREIDPSYDFKITLNPYKGKDGLDAIFNRFSAISKVSVQFTHARSPGRKNINSLVRRLRAQEIKTVIKAPDGQSLNKDELLAQGEDALEIAQAIDHIRVNARNGEIEIEGQMGDQHHFKVNTREPVLREVVDTGDSHQEFATAVFPVIATAMASATADPDTEEYAYTEAGADSAELQVQKLSSEGSE